MEFYCVSCKQKRETNDYYEITTKHNRRAAVAKCPICGTGMYRIMGRTTPAKTTEI